MYIAALTSRELLEMASLRELVFAAFLLGFDSFLAGLAIGPILSSWSARAWIVGLFGLCDGLALLLGTAGLHLVPEPPAAALYLLGVVLVILAARRSRAWLYAMPVLFSLDNLAAAGSASDAPALAVSSSAMAAAGLALGALGRHAAHRFVAAAAPA
jgi:hypothetical protein